MNTVTQYTNYIRPDWAPPSWLFGPVWTVLYILIAISFGYVFYRYVTGKIGWKIALPFLLNLIFNFSFTYFQFGIQSMPLASLDILLVLGTLVWAMYVARKKRWIVYANVPYLVWVSFATVLQITILSLNS
ncbi:MAG: TspO/MBR family protein [Candidatus Paceibacterota bacterium]